MSGTIECEITTGVAHVVMNRPEKRNALDEGLFSGLVETAARLAADRSVRAVVLSGAGGHFSSGLDVSSIGQIADGSLNAESDSVSAAAADLSADGANRAQQIAWAWYELPVPVIAAVEGIAFGGGLHIALAADMRIMAPDARLAFVETAWGLVPDLSGTQSLRRLVALDVAKKLIYTGREISGSEAVRLGLGTELSDTPIDDAFAMAREIAERSPDAIRAAKRLLNDSALLSLADGLANEFTQSASLMGTPNQIEAAMARLQKRTAEYQDPAA